MSPKSLAPEPQLLASTDAPKYLEHKEGDKARSLLGNSNFQKSTSIWTKLEKAGKYNSHANLHELGGKICLE